MGGLLQEHRAEQGVDEGPIHMQSYQYTGELYSVQYRQTFRAENIVLQFKPDKDGPGGFRFTINGKEDDEWFKQQRKKFNERIGTDIKRAGYRQGMKL